VDRRRWLSAQDFEDAIAACNLLPGPASTQLAIFCAWRVAGVPGALLGGVAFIAPGLVLIVALAALFLAASPPEWILGAGAPPAGGEHRGAPAGSPTRSPAPPLRPRSARGSCSCCSRVA
jgi:Chromate transporter